MTQEPILSSQIPFVISITGHRDLRPQDIAAIEREVRGVFAGLTVRMPNTPLLLLSGLAEGADQLAAEVALEAGVGVGAVLPMPLDVYRTTMSETAWERLESLLARVALTIELPLPHGVTLDAVRADEGARGACYQELAYFLARYGQALLALWDGKHSDQPGGTASVVHTVRSGIVRDEGDSHCGVVYQVLTPRLSGGDAPHQVRTHVLSCERGAVGAGVGHSAADEDRSIATFGKLQENIDEFNRRSTLEQQDSSARTPLISQASVGRSEFLQRVETLFGVADAMSVRANRELRWYLLGIVTSAIASALTSSFHGEMAPDTQWLWFFFPACVVATVVLHWCAARYHVEERYLDARALAEALRVQFFWELGGLHEPVDLHYLVHRRTELDWIRFALKNVWLHHLGADASQHQAPDVKLVLSAWVKDQAAWYKGRAERQKGVVERHKMFSSVGVTLAVLWSIAVPTLVALHVVQRGTKLYAAMHILLLIPAVLVGAYRYWIDQVGYEEQSREYGFMERLFRIKAAELEHHAGDAEVARELLLALGEEALRENGHWLMQHRERPLEVLSGP